MICSSHTSTEPPDSLPIDNLTNQQCQAIVFQLISSSMFKLVDWHLIGTRMNEANLFTEEEFYKVVNPRVVHDRNRVLTESVSRIGAFWLRTLYASLYSTKKTQGHVDVLRSISQRGECAMHAPMHTCMHIHTIYTHMHSYAHIHMYTHIHTHTHTRHTDVYFYYELIFLHFICYFLQFLLPLRVCLCL